MRDTRRSIYVCRPSAHARAGLARRGKMDQVRAGRGSQELRDGLGASREDASCTDFFVVGEQ